MNIYIKIFIIYTIIYLIIFQISLYKIFIKERHKGYESLIPIYNLWYYFSFIRIPKWVSIIIPLNIIAFIVSPYNLAKQFDLKRYTWWLAVLFPFIFVPYIAFSKERDKYLEVKINYYKNQKDIDALEEKLKNNKDEFEVSNVSKKDDIVDIKPNITMDEFNYKDELVEEKPEEIKDFIPDPAINEKLKQNINDDLAIDEVVNLAEYTNTNETIETFEEDERNTSVLENKVDNKEIDTLDETVSKQSQTNLTKQIQDYKAVGPSNEAIAFGGKDKIEHATETKNDELKCKRCGASLIGARGICPGCGMKL
jgi:hypothetical protein